MLLAQPGASFRLQRVPRPASYFPAVGLAASAHRYGLGPRSAGCRPFLMANPPLPLTRMAVVHGGVRDLSPAALMSELPLQFARVLLAARRAFCRCPSN